MYAHEKNIPLDIIEVDIGAGETHSDAYRAINALGETPVLIRPDGSILTESLAICRWLEDYQPEPNLLGHTADERADVNAWVDRLMFRLYVPLTHVFRHTHAFWSGRLQQFPEWGAAQRTTVLEEFGRLDEALHGREYLARDALSLADIVAFTSIDFGKPSGLRVDERYPTLRRWYERMKARPSAGA